MGFFFRKRIKLFPRVHLNLSKSGVSSSFGVKGAKVNVGRKGTYLNTSIPGTGIYGRHKLSRTSMRASKEQQPLPYAPKQVQRYSGAALCSFFLPGLGQLVKGQWGKTLLIWIIGGSLCLLFWSSVVVPLFIWLWNVYDAYRTVPKLQGL